MDQDEVVVVRATVEDIASAQALIDGARQWLRSRGIGQLQDAVRVTRRSGTNGLETVHVSGHAAALRDRPWLGRASTIAEAVAICDRLERGTGAGNDYDWSVGTVETSPGISPAARSHA